LLCKQWWANSNSNNRFRLCNSKTMGKTRSWRLLLEIILRTQSPSWTMLSLLWVKIHYRVSNYSISSKMIIRKLNSASRAMCINERIVDSDWVPYNYRTAVVNF
jgi:hypothetical protein